jgi:hypothetical protein
MMARARYCRLACIGSRNDLLLLQLVVRRSRLLLMRGSPNEPRPEEIKRGASGRLPGLAAWEMSNRNGRTFGLRFIMLQSCHFLLKWRSHACDPQLAVDATQRNQIAPIRVR